MFSVESAKKQIQKNSIENSILKTKVEFWGKLTDENEMDLTDHWASSILEGYGIPSGLSEAEKDTIRFYQTKIESLEKQRYAIA